MGTHHDYHGLFDTLSKAMASVTGALMIVCSEHSPRIETDAAERESAPPAEIASDDTPVWLGTLRACMSWQAPGVAPAHVDWEQDAAEDPHALDRQR